MADKFLFLQKIYGIHGVHLVNKEKLNADADFDNLLNDQFNELHETYDSLYCDIAPFLLEEDSQAKIAQYLRDNAEDIARHLTAMSLRFLRHPHSSRQYKPFSKYYHVLDEADWDALETELLGYHPDTEEECGRFADRLQNAFDNMNGDDVDAILAVRFGSTVADRDDPAVIQRYNAAMTALKVAVQ